jgi:DnaJ-class molecular chaperone
MPAPGHPGERGDLFAKVDVRLPRHLTRQQREHYEALAKLEDSEPPSAG